MSSLERRLKALEVHQTQETRNLSPEALSRLTDEELDALEDGIEEALQSGMKQATFEDLYAVASERSRRALEAYFEALEAAKGESPAELSRDPPEISLEEGRNAYRIWKYSKHGK